MVLMLTLAVCGAPCDLASSSEDGPTFSDYGDFYVDFIGSSGSVWLAVTVRDEDGVHTVIGSVSNIFELEWHNVTMVESSTIQNRYYGQNNVSLPEGDHTYEFHVKYYASDTLGNWNASNVTHYYLTKSDPWRVPNTILTMLEILAGTSGGVVVLIVVLRRRNR
jgi:hypothetical protein